MFSTRDQSKLGKNSHKGKMPGTIEGRYLKYHRGTTRNLNENFHQIIYCENWTILQEADGKLIHPKLGYYSHN